MTQTPEQIADSWASRLGQSTQKITDGVNAVTVAPGTLAARQKTVWVQNTTAAADKWATNTQAVTLDQWKADMIAKGVARIAGGASAAQPKFASFMSALLPHIDRVRGTLPPRGGLDANINRMVAFSRGMSQFKNPK